MRHDTFELLTALAEGAADASQIGRRLEELGAGMTTPTLYRRLKDVIDAGWVEVVGVQDSAGRGRPGQQYRITASGRLAAKREASRWRALADGWLAAPDGSS